MWNITVALGSNLRKFVDYENNYVLKYTCYISRKAMITMNVIVEQIETLAFSLVSRTVVYLVQITSPT